MVFYWIDAEFYKGKFGAGGVWFLSNGSIEVEYLNRECFEWSSFNVHVCERESEGDGFGSSSGLVYQCKAKNDSW